MSIYVNNTDKTELSPALDIIGGPLYSADFAQDDNVQAKSRNSLSLFWSRLKFSLSPEVKEACEKEAAIFDRVQERVKEVLNDGPSHAQILKLKKKLEKIIAQYNTPAVNVQSAIDHHTTADKANRNFVSRFTVKTPELRDADLRKSQIVSHQEKLIALRKIAEKKEDKFGEFKATLANAYVALASKPNYDLAEMSLTDLKESTPTLFKQTMFEVNEVQVRSLEELYVGIHTAANVEEDANISAKNIKLFSLEGGKVPEDVAESPALRVLKFCSQAAYAHGWQELYQRTQSFGGKLFPAIGGQMDKISIRQEGENTFCIESTATVKLHPSIGKAAFGTVDLIMKATVTAEDAAIACTFQNVQLNTNATLADAANAVEAFPANEKPIQEVSSL